MSIENRKTLEAYQKTAKKYLENSIEHNQLDIEKAKKKKEKLESFLEKSFRSLPKGSKILEIGSADGENAKYLKELGYDVIASDVADDFLKAISEAGFDPLKFNVLEDEFKEKYFGIFCWRVFVHFTKEDALKVIKKVYDALEENGIFVFNAINRETRKTDEEWVDFPGEYHMGIDRFYHYHTAEDLEDAIAETDFDIIDFHKEGGDQHNKWLVYVLKKQ